MTLASTAGTVLVTRPGRSAPEVDITDIPVGSEIRTEPNAQASLTFSSPDGRLVLATVSVFGNSILQLNQADSPRYATGIDPHRIILRVISGRIRATVGVDVPRQVRIEVQSDPGADTVMDQPGSNVSIEVQTTVTMITVRDGQAIVSAQGANVPLGKDQRAQVAAQSAPTGPLPAEQNVIKDGDFADPLAGTWVTVSPPVADANELPGTADVMTVDGRRTVQLSRTGTNWAHIGLTQDINRDVQGMTSLRLNLDIRIDSQDLRNCGSQGTECPLMIKISYLDAGGSSVEWLQGFYGSFDPNPKLGLTYCATCFPIQYKHMLWPLAEWKTYTSDDLLQLFATNGAPAAFIKSIAIYGEGHSFQSLFTDVQLLANE